MAKRVLEVGNCALDRVLVQDAVRRHFGAEVESVTRHDDAWRKLQERQFDLVLVNRRLSGDGTPGIELISRIKGDPATAPIPVMLLSDYEEYQAQAVAAGAEPGIGKSHIESPDARKRLARYLDAPPELESPAA